jgi:hypothetical protein
MKKDVIICAFACSSQAPCHEWKDEFFEDPPLIINVPGGGGRTFRSKAASWASTGDLFRAALRERMPEMKDVEIGRRGLVTFSAGWSFADQLLKYKIERERVDAYLLLDGCHTSNLSNWAEFGKRAARGEAFLAMAHSSIKPPYISAGKSNGIILDRACEAEDKVECIVVPDHVLDKAIPEGSVKISLAGAKNSAGKLVLPPISKVWTSDPLIEHDICGNAVKLWYAGNDRPDHVYIAWHTSKRLWKWLGEFWSTVAEEVEPVEPPEPPEPDVDEPDIIDEPDAEVGDVTDPPHQNTKNILQIIIEFILMIINKLAKKK